MFVQCSPLSTAMCQPGSYSSDGLIPCVPCERDSYTDATGQLECQACPDGTITVNVGQDSVHDCITEGKNHRTSVFLLF